MFSAQGGRQKGAKNKSQYFGVKIEHGEQFGVDDIKVRASSDTFYLKLGAASLHLNKSGLAQLKSEIALAEKEMELNVAEAKRILGQKLKL